MATTSRAGSSAWPSKTSASKLDIYPYEPIAVFLAKAKKSNAIYVALGEAEADVQGTSADPVPLHLRNASTSLMKEAGYGKGYRYAHSDPDAVDEMRCMPDSLKDRRYFNQEE